MTERKYELKPRDVLFFRDGRPMDADKTKKNDVCNVGHGAIWPRPDHLFNGVMHSLLKVSLNADYGSFTSLKIVGPYPVKGDMLYLPRPLDWDMDIELCTDTDLPEPLEYGFIDRVDGKKKYPAWIKVEDYLKYLRSEDRGCSDKSFSYADSDLFGIEPRIGTTIDSKTGASMRVEGARSGQYRGEYLRLKDDVSMWCMIETGKVGVKADAPDASETPRAFVMGGQGGIVTRQETDVDLLAMFAAPKVNGEGEVFVRWTLISPALFKQTGWLPGWCRDSRKNVAESERKDVGSVMFPGCEGCKLVGACTGKPIAFSGYDTKDGIKPTVLAVPQGSVYLFKCNSAASANALISRLHLQRQSDDGPKGFGIGICSVVTPTAVGRGHDKSPSAVGGGHEKDLINERKNS